MSANQLDDHGTDRRQFLGRAAATGAGVLVGGGALDALIPSFAAAKKRGVKKGDLEILGAAQIAEALAVTTYTNIINSAPFFTRLAADDQELGPDGEPPALTDGQESLVSEIAERREPAPASYREAQRDPENPANLRRGLAVYTAENAG